MTVEERDEAIKVAERIMKHHGPVYMDGFYMTANPDKRALTDDELEQKRRSC